jgi:hypothetical protein
MVRITDVKLGKILGAQEPIEGLPNQGPEVPIFLCDNVEASVVDKEVEAPVFLRHKEYWRAGGRGRWTYPTAFQMLPEIFP